MSKADYAIDTTFRLAEETGLKLAIRGRFIALIILGTAMIATRSPERALGFLTLFAGFALIGFVHYKVIGSRFDRTWVKYLALTLDVALICVAITVGRLHESADVPQYLVFRTNIYPFLFLFLAVSAFSFSPGLILWAGVSISVGWMAAFYWLTHDLEGVVGWSHIPSDATAETYLAVFLSPKFASSGSRLQEIVVMLVTAAVLAGVMYRARQTMKARLQAEEESRAVEDLFGQYVPSQVVDSLVRERGVLDPIERDATVLFTDLAGFTSMTENLGPSKTVAVLNAYFDAAAEIIARHQGVITQFQGDAVVASFNVPIEIQNHAEAAVKAGLEIQTLTDEREFDGVALSARVGIATGRLVAGSVGGGGRQTYTVHGDVVNLAARLEAMNKEFNTRIALSEATALAAQETFDFIEVAETPVRGQSKLAKVYTL